MDPGGAFDGMPARALTIRQQNGQNEVGCPRTIVDHIHVFVASKNLRGFRGAKPRERRSALVTGTVLLSIALGAPLTPRSRPRVAKSAASGSPSMVEVGGG